MNVSQNITLRELIEQAVTKRDASVRRLTQLAQDKGYKVNHTTIGQLRNGSYKYDAPSTDTIRAIAYLAGVDESVAFTAAGQPVPGPPLADELPPGADNLSPKSRKAVVDMVRVLVDLESSNNAERTQPEADTKPTLRAVAPTSNPRTGQKNDADEYGITEIHGDATKDYPAPPIESLAAHPKTKTIRELLDEETGERGDMGGEA